MTLPHAYWSALLLMILSMICWGSWANTFKLTKKWRFELYYYDYAIGVLLCAVIAAFTFGSLGFDGFTFLDDLSRAGKRNMAYGFAGGVVFNLANMLLVAAISVAGLAVAFPIGIGLALVIGVVGNYIVNPQGDLKFLAPGVALVVAAIIVDAVAYRRYAEEKAQQAPAKKKASKKPLKGILLSLAAGVLMGSFYPLVEMGKATDIGLGPYAIAVVFAAGVFLSTFVFNLFFTNFPVQGPPVDIFDYFRTGNLWYHLLGVLGGVVWCVGAVANFVAASAPRELVEVGPAISYALGQGATMVSALWGLLVWKEFAGASAKVTRLIVAMLVLFIAGLTLVSLAVKS